MIFRGYFMGIFVWWFAKTVGDFKVILGNNLKWLSLVWEITKGLSLYWPLCSGKEIYRRIHRVCRSAWNRLRCSFHTRSWDWLATCRWLSQSGVCNVGCEGCAEFGKRCRNEQLFSFIAKIKAPSERVMQKIGMEKTGELNHPKLSNDWPRCSHM